MFMPGAYSRCNDNVKVIFLGSLISVHNVEVELVRRIDVRRINNYKQFKCVYGTWLCLYGCPLVFFSTRTNPSVPLPLPSSTLVPPRAVCCSYHQTSSPRPRPGFKPQVYRSEDNRPFQRKSHFRGRKRRHPGSNLQTSPIHTHMQQHRWRFLRWLVRAQRQ